MKALHIACLFASAAALAAATITVETVDLATIETPAYSGPKCLAKSGANTLGSARTALVVADGSSADDVAAAYEFLSKRVDTTNKPKVFCAPSSANAAGDVTPSALLLRSYYPIGKVTCETMGTTFALADYSLVVVAEGYAATLPMRRDTTVHGLVQAFAATNGLNNDTVPSTLLLHGGAAELLIDAGIIADNKTMACGNMPTSATPAIAAAVRAACKHDKASIVQKAEVDLHVSRRLIVGNDLSLMLSTYEARHTGAGAVPDVRCNNTDTTVPFDYESAANTASIVAPSSANIERATAATDAALEPANASTAVADGCSNSQGVNFCSGVPTSLVVAHGSHARTVASLAANINALPSFGKVYCPNSEDEHVVAANTSSAYVYLSAEPAFVPTHRVLCTDFFNRTDTLSHGLVVVADGPVATHRTLRVNDGLVKATQYATTFSAYGSALTLLTSIANNAAATVAKEESKTHAKGAVSNAPYCADTNADMEVLGFNSTHAPTEVMFFRDNMERRTVVLGANREPTHYEHNVVDFATYAVKSLAWENAPNAAPDIYVMIYALGFSGVIVIGLLVILCVRARGSASRNARDARSRSGSSTEPLASKYA